MGHPRRLGRTSSSSPTSPCAVRVFQPPCICGPRDDHHQRRDDRHQRGDLAGGSTSLRLGIKPVAWVTAFHGFQQFSTFVPWSAKSRWNILPLTFLFCQQACALPEPCNGGSEPERLNSPHAGADPLSQELVSKQRPVPRVSGFWLVMLYKMDLLCIDESLFSVVNIRMNLDQHSWSSGTRKSCVAWRSDSP